MFLRSILSSARGPQAEMNLSLHITAVLCGAFLPLPETGIAFLVSGLKRKIASLQIHFDASHLLFPLSSIVSKEVQGRRSTFS
jgi:hypothetical protein